MTQLNIIPECHADTRLVEILAQLKRCNHKHGIGNVANNLLNENKERPALGVVDDDKKSIPNHFKQFIEIQSFRGLRLLKHTQKTHYLIVIRPAIEGFLIMAAKDSNILLSDFNLEETVKTLGDKSKAQHIRNNQDFTRFIKRLVSEKSPSIIQMKEWLDDFIAGKLE